MAAIRRRAEAFPLPIGDRTLQRLVQMLKLLGDDSRLRILLMLARYGELNVSAMCKLLGESQPAVSHHLTMMRMANLIGFRREGKFNYYFVDGANFGETLEKLFDEVGRGSTLQCGEFSLTYARSAAAAAN